MAQPFEALRERLLRAGMAPRHVRRYLRELADHLADLSAEEEQAGRSPEDAQSAARARLGTVDELAQAMIQRPQFRSWCARAPWAMFSVGALGLLAAAYFLACLYLWCGWRVFVPGAETPFDARVPMYSLANIYFQAGKFYYTCAPIFAAWGIGVVAVRQRLKAVWPLVGFLLIAFMGASAHIEASRTAVAGAGHIRMSFFTLASSGAGSSDRLIYACVVLTLAALPYLFMRLHQARSSHL
jgi:hypothetical protein